VPGPGNSSTTGAKKPTPYMDKRRLEPGGETVDPDERVLSDDDLERAKEEGKEADQAQG